MRKKPLALLLLTAATLHADVEYCDAPCQTPAPCFSSCECCEGPNYARATLRHIEPGGIGYDHGYTSLDLFWAQDLCWANWYGFIDARGHVFNDGKWATNLGIGIRTLTDCYDLVVGGNVYWDWREAKHTNFHQIGAGLEFLWPCWDLRIDGYVPVNRHKKRFRNRFEGFRGHEALAVRKWELALWGVDAALGYWLYRCDCFALHAAIAGYYFRGDFDKHAGGGLLRAKMQLWDWVEVRGQVSYDNLFRWQGQGELALTLPFGCHVKRYPRMTRCCPDILALEDRLVEQPERFEIIVTTTKKKRAPALSPITGLPLQFIFVDNTSHSDGTIEHPFPTLAQAQNASQPTDVIYVFPGDGTDKGMNQGITLKDDIIFTSSFLPFPIHTRFGDLVVPASSSVRPKISNIGDVVRVANRDTVQGFEMTGTHSGVAALNPIQDLNVFTNIIRVSSDTGAAIGIFFKENFNGTFNASDNSISASSSVDFAEGIGFHKDVGGQSHILNNNISAVSTALATSFASGGIYLGTHFGASLEMTGNNLFASVASMMTFGLWADEFVGSATLKNNSIAALSNDSALGQALGVKFPTFSGNLSLLGNNISANTVGNNAFGIEIDIFEGTYTSNQNNIAAKSVNGTTVALFLSEFTGTLSSSHDQISAESGVTAEGIVLVNLTGSYFSSNNTISAKGAFTNTVVVTGVAGIPGNEYSSTNDTIVSNATSFSSAVQVSELENVSLVGDKISATAPIGSTGVFLGNFTAGTSGIATVQSCIISSDTGSALELFFQNQAQSLFITDNILSAPSNVAVSQTFIILNDGSNVQAKVENNTITNQSNSAEAFADLHFSGFSHLRLVGNTIQAPSFGFDGSFSNFSGNPAEFEVESNNGAITGVESLNNNCRLTDNGFITYVPLSP